MRAMALADRGNRLIYCSRPVPHLGDGELLLKVCACAVCRTDLHIVDRELPRIKPGIIPGHEIIGTVVAAGRGVDRFRTGDRVGVPWLSWTCGRCSFCLGGRENLCPAARFTGCDRDGGFAEYSVADARYCFAIPACFDDVAAAPLMCAGLIGYRALRMAGDARRIGFYGFGAAAHILAQIAGYQGRTVFAFTRPDDAEAQAFARSLGAVWAGGPGDEPPEPLDAAIIFAPAGELVPAALARVAPGGIVVCAGIHMSAIPSFPYALLWQERSVCSVANLTRRDGEELLALAAAAGVRTETTAMPLERANTALDQLRRGALRGAAVLVP